MALDENQYLPNDCTVQINYKPNPRVLDHRGEWAQSLCKHLELEKWVIIENKFDVFDAAKTIHAYAAFNRCGMTCMDVERRESFPEKAEKFLEFLFSLPEFGNPVSVLRIGVKPRFCTSFKGTFDLLLKRVQERYVDLKRDAHAAVGESVTLVDIGAPVNFRDEHGNFNSACGPMRREQMKQTYFQYKDEDELPAVGLFYEIDYFVLPNEEMSGEEVIRKVRSFSDAAWSRHQRIRKLIVGG